MELKPNACEDDAPKASTTAIELFVESAVDGLDDVEEANGVATKGEVIAL